MNNKKIEIEDFDKSHVYGASHCDILHDIMLSEDLAINGSAKGNFIRKDKVCEECIVEDRGIGNFPNQAMVTAIQVNQSLVVVAGGLQPCLYSKLSI